MPPPTSGNLPAPPDPDECLSPAPIDVSSLPWKPPAVSPGACTQSDLDALVKYVETSGAAEYTQLKGAVASTTCRACIFGPDGATWPPIVENSSGQPVVVNVGGCIAIASGNEACGKAYQNWYDCRFEACVGCEDDDVSFQKCLAAASKSACKKAFDAVTSVCTGPTIADAETACQSDKLIFEGAVRAQCIGLVDGGTDGGDGDGG
jgi:hypothetical protein